MKGPRVGLTATRTVAYFWRVGAIITSGLGTQMLTESLARHFGNKVVKTHHGCFHLLSFMSDYEADAEFCCVEVKCEANQMHLGFKSNVNGKVPRSDTQVDVSTLVGRRLYIGRYTSLHW